MYPQITAVQEITFFSDISSNILCACSKYPHFTYKQSKLSWFERLKTENGERAQSQRRSRVMLSRVTGVKD
ncbi:hypothetical protein DVH24_040076 [Malus domestica]|uniref:Uncharacterized protein n=1 Tax=Malus domestica TaxID=3750 RepID=A0A498I7R0_MALDO|nr:hypothetical protein DVH24_040076 [Malus domestica]